MADPLGGGAIPLKVLIDRMNNQREAALQAANPSSEQQSFIRLLGRLDQVPGLAALPDDYPVGFKEVDELMLMLDLLSKRAQ